MPERPTLRVGMAGLLALAATYGLGRQAYGLFVPSFRAEFTLGLDAVGYLAGAAQFGYLVATVATGVIEARFGPRLPVVAGCILLAVGAVLVATAGATGPLVVGVILAGTSAGGAWAPFSDAVAQRVPRGRQRRALALVNAGSPAGLLIASLVVAITGSSWRLAWAAFALVGLVAAAVNAAVLPNVPPTRDTTVEWGWKGLVAPSALRLFAVAALASMTSGAYFAYAPEAAQAAGLPTWIGAAMWGALGLSGGAVGAFGGEIADRFSLGRPLAVTWLGLAAALASLLVVMGTPAGALGSAAVFGVTFTTGYAFIAMWSQEVFPQRPTTGFTVTIVFIAAGFVVGPILYGVVATFLGRPWAPVVAAVPAVLAAVLSVAPPARRRTGT
ncbi:MAG: MFS transporter [Trueperaceae bacterium]|nr:MFS transporter [Trueperaceae bacterium]